MSRIGKQPVKIPTGVKVELAGGGVKISGAKDSLSLSVHPDMKIEYDADAAEVRVTRPNDARQCRALHGTTRALIANMVSGVTTGFRKELQIYGSGYGIKVEGNMAVLALGYAQPAKLAIPAGVSIEIKTPNARGNDVPAEFAVTGADKCAVGQFASELRRARPPEPYKGKGVRYSDERIKHKMGKAFASGA